MKGESGGGGGGGGGGVKRGGGRGRALNLLLIQQVIYQDTLQS